MQVVDTAIPEVRKIVPRRFEDARGYFVEVYNRRALAENGIDIEFVQDNQSLSRQRGTIRGLHFQTPPFAQDKLVRVLRGAILDVAVDVRAGSPTFGQHVAVELSERDETQLLVPVGFAHGFCTLEPDTVVAYKVSAFYSREHDAGIRWDDPALGIAWPVAAQEAALSEKDLSLPLLSDIAPPFQYRPDAGR